MEVAYRSHKNGLLLTGARGAISLCAMMRLGAHAADPADMIETILVTASPSSANLLALETRHGIDQDSGAISNATALDEVLTQLPSAHIPTNSRGESILFLRNAGERQVGLFFEGAAINVPWDNRLDLNLFPTGLVGSVRSASGPIAPHYGVNSLGAVNLVSRDTADEINLSLVTGEADLTDIRGLISLPLDESSGFSLGGSYSSQDGEPLASRDRLPFFQSDGDIRANTDRELASLFGQYRLDLTNHRLRFTLVDVTGEKGIAPESDRPSGVRFWRYPDVDHSLGIISINSMVGDALSLDTSLWYQRFGQVIDAYQDISYTTVSAREVDRDRTWGIRELLTYDSEPWRYVVSVNYLDSTHDQRDIDYENGHPPGVLPDELGYGQRNWSVGGEVEYRIHPDLIGEVGVGYDQVDYVKTGDKPPMDAIGDWTGRAGLIWRADEELSLRASVGRKVRMPTMRELFGQALNRFLINPDLQPETITTTEIGAEWRKEKAAFFAIPFYQYLEDTIDQRRVGALRQRINLEGSTVMGLELGGKYDFAEHWQLAGTATYADARKRGEAPGESDHIAEKPRLLANVRLAYEPDLGIRAALEVAHVGQAFSADDGGDLVPLEISTSVNLRMAYRLAMYKGVSELFLNIENLGNTYIEPQIGLPEGGRWIRGGVRLSL